MNFINKMTKKPSKQNIRPKKKEGTKSKNNEEEYIEVDLEIEEERPPVPLFIGGQDGINNIVSGGDFDDEFFDGAVEDDLELGEEAIIFYDKQKNNSFRQPSSNNLHQHSFHQMPPVDVPMTPYGIAAPMDPNHHPYAPPPVDNVNHSYIAAGSYHASPAIIGFQPGIDSSKQISHSPAVGGLYFAIPAPATPAVFPAYIAAPAPPPIHGLTELEMVEFHQLLSNGVPELDAIRTIQYNRIIHHPPQTPMSLSRTASGIPTSQPPAHHSVENEDDEIYQLILKESIEEEKKRQQRVREAEIMGQDDLTPDEAMKIAIQQSYDDYERQMQMRGDIRSVPTHPQYGSPSVNSSNHASSQRSMTKSSTKSQKMMSSIEKANEEALRQAIMLSMQEANNSATKRPPNMSNQQYSQKYNHDGTYQTPKALNSLDSRIHSTATRSGSSDNYNDYIDHGLVPDNLAHSPYHSNADPFLGRQSSHPGTSDYPPRGPPPTASSINSSGHFSPAVSNASSSHGHHLNREFYPTNSNPSAAQKILSRRNNSNHPGGGAGSFYGSDSLQSRSVDSQEFPPRSRRSYHDTTGLPPDSDFY